MRRGAYDWGMRKFGALVFLMMIAGGCSGERYHAWDGTTGFSEAQLRPEEYEVSFAADSEVSPTQARAFATIRAAELALERGKNYFEIVETHDGGTRETVVVPGSTMVNTSRSGSGSNRSYWTTVNETPGYAKDYVNPVATILVRFADQASANTLEARQVLREAQQKGVKLRPETVSRLGSGNGGM